jgi:hypothetical protein
MAHDVDGFQLSFIGRTWKAERREKGKFLDVVRVVWRRDTHPAPDRKGIMQGIWYAENERGEMEERMADPAPFVVAVAEAKDYSQSDIKIEFKNFTAVYEVAATGIRLGDREIETRVLRRLKGGGGDHHA